MYHKKQKKNQQGIQNYHHTDLQMFLLPTKVSQVDFKEQKFEDFYDLIPIRLSQRPWNYNISLEMGWRVS